MPAREIARIDVTPGQEAAFEAGAAQARPLFLADPGCSAMEIQRSNEVPGRYWLFVEWADVAAHEAFRQGPGFAEWRRLVGPTFASLPVVEHGLPV